MSKPTEDEMLYPIPGFINYYANKKGEIWKWENESWFRPKVFDFDRGYLQIFMKTLPDLELKRFSVHRLIARTFLGPPPTPTSYCCHKNDIKDDNRADNLYWGTPRTNGADSVKNRHKPENIRQREKIDGKRILKLQIKLEESINKYGEFSKRTIKIELEIERIVQLLAYRREKAEAVRLVKLELKEEVKKKEIERKQTERKEKKERNHKEKVSRDKMLKAIIKAQREAKRKEAIRQLKPRSIKGSTKSIEDFNKLLQQTHGDALHFYTKEEL